MRVERNHSLGSVLDQAAGAYPIVVVKSGYLSPEYKRLAKRAILALTPGDTCELLEQLPYRRVPRPIFPLDCM
jgi:microcystin degradation protein MlrC